MKTEKPKYQNVTLKVLHVVDSSLTIKTEKVVTLIAKQIYIIVGYNRGKFLLIE